MGWLSNAAYCIGGICVLGVAFGVALFLYQEKLLYFPTLPIKDPDDNPRGLRSPAEHGLKYEDMYMTTLDNVRIHGWLLRSSNTEKVPTILYFHGNAGNIGMRLINAKEMLQALQCNIFLVEYRGYGKSEGIPSEEGLVLDAEAALRALKEDPLARVDPDKLIVFGRSLGGAVAIAAAVEYPDQARRFWRALVVENTFLSISHMVDQVFPVLSGIKWLVLRLRWDSQERLKRLERPVLFFSG
ncbi:unnamed protein product, partial [Choristocarpus tenellus]